MGRFIDLTGQRFGRWTVLKCVGSTKQGTVWLCQCDCGTVREVTSKSLRGNVSNSCGCLHKEIVSSISRGNTTRQTHDMSRTRLYRIWVNMKYRCSPTCAERYYKLYYGRGIRVCAEWQDFETFAKWALNNGYSDELTIDRINNDGNYEPTNCRWVGMDVQANNTRNVKTITYKGKTLTLAQWERELNISSGYLSSRLRKGKKFEDIAKKKGL